VQHKVYVFFQDRYARRADKQRIAEWFHTHNTDVSNESHFAPSYIQVRQTRVDSEHG
jgi:hypothetical protein